MNEIILDTETTGLSITEKHKIVEIGCIELRNQIPTNQIFHEYINPERPISEKAYKIHGYTDEFLANKKTFSEVSKDFLNFIKDKKIIIHNAAFDLSFLNYELKLINQQVINKKNVKELISAIQFMINNKSKFSEYGNNSRKIAENKVRLVGTRSSLWFQRVATRNFQISPPLGSRYLARRTFAEPTCIGKD